MSIAYIRLSRVLLKDTEEHTSLSKAPSSSQKCDVHNRVTRYQPTPQEQAHRKKEALAERVEKLSRVRILETIRKKLPDALSRPDLEMVALDYFRRLGHDNHRRLSKLYAWEEKKSKNLMGRSDRGLRKDCGGCPTRHETRRR
jgi:hypothetical protein